MPSLATWFSPSLQTISRSAGRSSVLAAAYRSCEKLTDERLGITRDFRPKGKHGLASNICIGIPNDDIGLLFNNAEKAESRVNSTVARELMVPLPSGWTDDERAQCARGLGEMLRARYGVAVLVSIHRPSKDNNNDHVHILFTTRTVDADGVFGEKTRILDDAKTGEVKKLREAVCELVNIQARAQGEDWYVYAGKFAEVIENHIPITHISIAHGKNQQQYIEADRENVDEARSALAKINQGVLAREKEIAKLIAQAKFEAASQNTSQRPDGSGSLSMEAHAVKPALKRIEMPKEALKAKAQLDKAIGSRAILRQQYTAWKEMHTQLVASPPVPEYGFFGWPKARYKKGLAEYTESLKNAKEGMGECTAKAQKLVEFIQMPDRRRLHGVYQSTMAHNALVEAHEKQMAQEREQELALLEHDQAKREQEANRVDWSAYLRESPETRQEEATEYSNGGGMGL